MTSTTLRFHRLDNYENPVFICNEANEEKEFNKLDKIYEKLKEAFPDSYLPIYKNLEYNYITVRFVQDYRFTKLRKGDVYDLSFKVTSKQKNEKQMVFCLARNIKLVSRAPKFNYGETVRL